jgi:outer membrane lipoprotein SlyB
MRAVAEIKLAHLIAAAAHTPANGVLLRSGRERGGLRMRAVACVLVGALLLAGCAHPSSSTYETADVGRTIETAQGSVVSSRVVKIAGDSNAVGPLAGGALGAAGSGLAFKDDKLPLIAVIGGVLGAGAGYLGQRQLNNREGIEYVLELDDGRTVTLVQNRASEEVPLPDGTPVLVQVSGQYTRVIADPRAERMGGGAWVDPDTVPDEESPATGAAPIGAAGDPVPLGEPPPVSDQQ